jgi:hypothetical protein
VPGKSVSVALEFVCIGGDGLAVCSLREMVQTDHQGIGWKVWNQIDFGLVNLP